MTARRFLLLLLLGIAFPAAPRDAGPGYRKAGVCPLSDGTSVALLLDRRLSRRFVNERWFSGQVDFESEWSPAPRSAVAQHLDAAGHLTDRKLLGRPLAKLEPVALAPTGTACLLSVDFTQPMGAYNGPATNLVASASGTLVAVRAVGADGVQAEIRLARTLRQSWLFVPVGKEGRSEILQIQCDHDFRSPGDEFRSTYSRFVFDGLDWRRTDRHDRRCWDFSDQPYLLRSEFP
jgi:hypothetical protein